MDKYFIKLIFVSLITSNILLKIGYAQLNVEEYIGSTILKINWGNKPNEIGLVEKALGGISGKGIPGGPASFDVDNEGNIYILDTGNRSIKIFNENGDLIQYFIIFENLIGHGYICVDDKNSIWVHNYVKNTFRVYSFNGVLLKTIKYEGPFSSDFSIDNDVIYGFSNDIFIDEVSYNYGINGEKVYRGKIEKTKNDKMTLGGNIIFSKRNYEFPESNYTKKNASKLQFIVYNNSLTNTIIINDFDFISYFPYLFGEDIYDNFYIFLRHYDGIPTFVLKYDNSFILKTKIKVIEKFSKYHMEKPLIMDKYGNIYLLFPNDETVDIIKWFKKEK